MAEFQRDKVNFRLGFKGIDLLNPVDALPNGRVPYAANVRAYRGLAIIGRNLLTGALYTLAAAVHTLRRLNDSTPNGPSSGYSIINGAGTVVSAWNSLMGVENVATGLSGNPVSMIPFRPNTSVQPWMYVADSSQQGNVTIATKYLVTTGPNANASVNFVSNGMLKIRSDGRGYKMGVREPQVAPIASTSNSSVPFGGLRSMLATAIPWTNYNSANTNFNFGESSGYPDPAPDGSAPFLINCLNATYITITALSLYGTVVINGTTNPTLTTTSTGRVGAGSPGYPGQFLQNSGVGTHPTTASYIVGAFIDASGNVITTTENGWVAPLYVPIVVDVGVAFSTSTPITVPYGAVSFQIGVNSVGNTYSSNSGFITLEGTVTTNALPSVTSILGTLTLYYWGDSPNSGPVASYIWKNPDDSGGSGPTRSTSNANGSTSNNSFIFDATFTAGIPALPGTGNDTLPMQWTTLNSDSVASGSVDVFAAPLITTYPNNTNYDNFNFCLTGNIYFPAEGKYTFNLTNHDDVIWGIGGGVTLVSATSTFNGTATTPSISSFGQTITVVGGYPLLPRGPYNGGSGGDYSNATVVVNVPAAGIYPIEVDYDYWYHSGRILLLDASPTPGASATIIPPLPANVRQEVQYRYVYRSSATGAQSNPSPESTAETVPVTANTVTSYWSNDPQIDVVDYYRIDSATAEFTYVATGPNDNLGAIPGTNTPISDSLTDTELGTQLLSYDNFEPFPSLDLPQNGICSIQGGVITWVSGGAIGGTATGFNPRWLAGTTILIGSPTSLAYVFIARPDAAAFAATTAYALNWIIFDPNGNYQLVTTAGTSGGTAPTFNVTVGGTTTSGGVTFTNKGIYIPTGYVGQVTIPGVPNATNVAYEIEQPILANQPLPYMWGPTDNINFTYAVGDPLRPGTLYWCAGSNLDAAPDTNQEDITDPSEPLVNGAITKGLGVVFSIKRAWLILPNFFNATATATGVVGSTWSLQESGITRGLYMPRCVAIEGGGNIFFRVNDGIHVSPGGGESKSITDQDLYPLFPHESEDGGTSVPNPVTIAGYTVYPPNDSLPQAQRFEIVGAYLYYDYLDATSTPRTLVFDMAAMGWVVDVYTPLVTIHAENAGSSVVGTLAGCSDGTVRQMASGGAEVATAVFLTPAYDKGDTRATAKFGDLYIESTNP